MENFYKMEGTNPQESYSRSYFTQKYGTTFPVKIEPLELIEKIDERLKKYREYSENLMRLRQSTNEYYKAQHAKEQRHAVENLSVAELEAILAERKAKEVSA